MTSLCPPESKIQLVYSLTLIRPTSYAHLISVKLSLPLPSALTLSTILLPFLAAANHLSLINLLSRKSTQGTTARSLTHKALQLLQGLVTTILTTLYTSSLLRVRSDNQHGGCDLTTRWQDLFRAKDARAVRAIQDELQCCGLRSVAGMAWPFPPADDPPCAVRFDRVLACWEPWREVLVRAAWLDLGVVLLVGGLQVSLELEGML